MILPQTPRRQSGYNVIDLLVLLGVLGLLVAVAVPAFMEVRNKSRQVDCTGNLQQIGVGFRQWSDQMWDFPMALSTNYSGTREVAQDVWRTFQVMSNELAVPGVLVCPADGRRPASAWASLASSNVSYLIGLDAMIVSPLQLLSGDRHLDTGKRPQNNVLKVRDGDVVRWAKWPHPSGGNLLFGDGSVRPADDAQLQATFQHGFTNEAVWLPGGVLRIALPE